jgi:hypothetical protein
MALASQPSFGSDLDRGPDRRPARWAKVAGLGILGVVAAFCLSAGAYTISPVYPGEPAVNAYQAATPCTSTSSPGSNCYLTLPVTIVTYRWEHYIKGHNKEFITVSSEGHGVAELLFAADQPISGLAAGMAGSVRTYQGKPVVLDLGATTLLTEDNPVVLAGNPRQIGFIVLILGLGLLGLLLYRLGAFSSSSAVVWRTLTPPQWLVAVGIPLALGLYCTYRFFR